MTYTVTFWGTRGSIPTPGSETARYGGNTPCVAVERQRAEARHLVVLDAGTGIRPLGKALGRRETGPVAVDLLISHTHWDHIQGLPFFAPFFNPVNTVRIWGAQQGDVGLGTILRQQMHPVVFPVPLDALAAHLGVQHVEPGSFQIDGFTVDALRLRHPGTTLGYSLAPADGGPKMAYLTDNELGDGGRYDVGGPGWRRACVAFLEGADVLIHDAMYSPDELRQYRGWGHSSYEEAIALASEAGVKRLVLFHHRPEHDDVTMDAMMEGAQAAAASHGGAVEVMAATEGLQLTL
jgi:phosphoribosyl 1,2-cyclic phosphodiesterase